MEQTTKTQLATDTRAAVLIVTGMIGAFAVGMGFIMSISQSVSTVAEPEESPVSTAQPLYATAVHTMQVSGNPPSAGVEDASSDIIISGADASGNITTQFGAYTDDNGSYEYIAGSPSATARAIVVDFTTTTHPATLLSLGIVNNAPSAQAIPGIPTANAQVYIGTPTMVCIPEKTTASVTVAPESQAPRWLPTAHAQVNVNTNTCTEGQINGCYICTENQWQYDSTIPGCAGSTATRYYVSDAGNVYTDAALLHRVNTVDCAAQIAKGYAPNDLTAVSANRTIDLGQYSNLVLAKSWQVLLGLYNSTDGFTDQNTDTFNHQAPLFILGSNATGDTTTLPEATLTVTSDLGTKNLCLPGKQLQDDEWFVYFYDKNGKPYSDMTLTQAVSCGTTNSCASVNCVKYPKHACCIAAPVSPDAQ